MFIAYFSCSVSIRVFASFVREKLRNYINFFNFLVYVSFPMSAIHFAKVFFSFTRPRNRFSFKSQMVRKKFWHNNRKNIRLTTDIFG